MERLRKQQMPDTIEVSYNDFSQCYALFCFDLTPDQTCGSGTVAHPGGCGLTISIQFGAVTGGTLKVICVAENSALLEIDSLRTVTVTNL
jgi:hypothetical protein